MPKLGICEHEIVKISNKKGTLEIFWTNIGILQYKESSKFVIHALYENFLESNLWLIAKKEAIFIDSSLGIIFN